uniref:Uncharacterized protein n=1 Tax=Plectus sambesii TaxID=2011161 RepID=A0A914W191_9BILA
MLVNDLLLSEAGIYAEMEAIPKINELLNQVEQKEKNESRKAAVEYLVMELQQFSNAAYHIFMDAIEKTGQKDIADKIIKEIRPNAVHIVLQEKKAKSG